MRQFNEAQISVMTFLTKGDREIQGDGVSDHKLRGDGLQRLDGERGGSDHQELGRAPPHPRGDRFAQGELREAPHGHPHRGQALAEGLQAQGRPRKRPQAFPEICQVPEQQKHS